MHVISQKMLRLFWAEHRDAERPLRTWFKVVSRAAWVNFGDVRALYPQADQVGKFTVFNIRGNHYRLIAVIHYNRGKVYVRHVLTHAEYDEGRWKED
jgi:mRNA interferase HigB